MTTARNVGPRRSRLLRMSSAAAAAMRIAPPHDSARISGWTEKTSRRSRARSVAFAAAGRSGRAVISGLRSSIGVVTLRSVTSRSANIAFAALLGVFAFLHLHRLGAISPTWDEGGDAAIVDCIQKTRDPFACLADI